MAKGVPFGEETAVLGPPPGHGAEVYCLPIQRYRSADGNANVLSAWKLSYEELEEVKRTGIVYFNCWGLTLAPMFITGIYPEGNVEHNIYIVENDEHMMRLAKEVDDLQGLGPDITDRQYAEVQERKRAIELYISNK